MTFGGILIKPLIVFATLALSVGSMAAEPTAIVRTVYGPVRGTTENGINSFLGIPFAKPPVGSLRWRPPQKPSHSTSIREANHFAASCQQPPPVVFGPYTAEFQIVPQVNEDCLFLNVWAPTKHAGSIPVYVFIHGGAFTGGSGSIPIYDGSSLASKGVVTVTVNYRLGVFGFLAHPELSEESSEHVSGNYGTLDVIAALQWVHDNIRKFGGDPRRVTIGGQSAGAILVNDLIVSRQAKGLFARGIAESGTAMGLPTPTLREAEEIGVEFAKSAGNVNIAQLRATSAEQLLEMSLPPRPAPGKEPAVPILRFVPNADKDVISTPPDGGVSLVSNVPLLTGYNFDEASLFESPAATQSKFEVNVRRRFGEYADRVLALYPHDTDDAASESAQVLARDRYMAGLILFSQARAQHSGQKVYQYMFEHAYPGPEAAVYRSFHTAEVPYVFGALHQKGRVFSDQDRAVSEQVQQYWVNFIYTGDPGMHGQQTWRGWQDGTVMCLGDHEAACPAVSTPERLAMFKDWVALGHTLGLL